jgi:peptide/nickel transport system ATP-binding protein
MRLIDTSGGRILFDGQEIGAIAAKKLPSWHIASAFRWCSRTPPDSLDPRFTAQRAIADALLVAIPRRRCRLCIVGQC